MKSEALYESDLTHVRHFLLRYKNVINPKKQITCLLFEHHLIYETEHYITIRK